jgi:hypothetical protein
MSTPTLEPPAKEQRFSFKFADGKYPMRGKALAWLSDRSKAIEQAKSWGADSLVVLEQNQETQLWDIVEETKL